MYKEIAVMVFKNMESKSDITLDVSGGATNQTQNPALIIILFTLITHTLLLLIITFLHL